MQSLTLGAGNSAPRVGPVVINEVMYHPPLGYDEFVELHNLSGSAVSLFDAAYPTNAWKLSGLNYTFSNSISIPVGGYLLVVPTDPATFRTKYSIPGAVQIVGPYSGVLQDSGERLTLERPDAPDTNGVPYIVVDEVRYNDKVPWPVGADGDGPSIQRIAPTRYGNEPTNWFASGITPGAANVLNQPPIVALTSPTNGAVFNVPATVTLTASASDPDGTVTRVEFYEGDIKIGEATSAPFTFTWINVGVGSHAIVAKARDNRLAVVTSSAVTITVNPPPIGTGIGLRGDYYDNIDFTGTRVRRVDPGVNFDWGGGSPDPAIAADTFSARWTGQVQPRFSEAYTFNTLTDDGVRLWVNGQLVIDHWIDQSPTEWSGVISLQAGVLYDIRMDYFENGGGAAARLFWSSPSVTKEVIPSTQLYPPTGSNLPPTVTLTAPATNSVFVAGSPLSFAANALDPDGAIFKVEFFANNVKVGEDTVTPFTFSWINNTAGSFALKAIATDDSGLTRTSSIVNVTFLAGFGTNVTLIATGSVWKYLDNGSDQGGAWEAIGFNDVGWTNGPAQLGYGDGDERTVVGYGPNSAAKYITTYFRRTFVVNDPVSFSALNLRVLRDDGVVVHLNGSEVFRDNMPGGAVGYLTPASANVSAADETVNYYGGTVNPGYLVFGTNVIAAEIHQVNGTSTDISFDFELTGVQSYIAPYLLTQPTNQTVAAGGSVSFVASAAGSSPLAYQWRFNSTNIVGATNSTFTRANVQPAHAGTYVVVITNVAGSVTSQIATLTVNNTDTDGDGMPDAWETLYGLNASNPNDAVLDNDGDGMTNVQEYRAGTNPIDALSVLKLTVSSRNPLRLQFIAQSNLSYSVQFNSNISVNSWLALSNIGAQPLIRTVIVADPSPPTNTTRFYRAVTP